MYLSSTSSSAALQPPTVKEEQPKGREVFTEGLGEDFSRIPSGKRTSTVVARKKRSGEAMLVLGDCPQLGLTDSYTHLPQPYLLGQFISYVSL